MAQKTSKGESPKNSKSSANGSSGGRMAHISEQSCAMLRGGHEELNQLKVRHSDLIRQAARLADHIRAKEEEFQSLTKTVILSCGFEVDGQHRYDVDPVAGTVTELEQGQQQA